MKRIVVLAVVIAVVVIGWSAGWWYVANEARAAVLSLAGGDGTTTPRLTCRSLGTGGWPFQVNLDCTEPVLISGDTRLTLPDLKAAAVVYDPSHVLVYAAGPMTISDAFTGSRQALAFNHLEASVRVTGWRIGRISVVADGLVLTDALMGDALIARAAHAELHLIDLPDAYDPQKHLAGVRTYAVIEALDVPGIAIDKGGATLDATITGLPDDVRTYGDPGFAQRVQQAGGVMKITTLKAADGDDFLDATGQVSLDARGRPEGRVTVASRGLVDRLAGLVPQQLQGMVFGAASADGSHEQTLTMSNGVLLAGLIPVAGLPSVF